MALEKLNKALQVEIDDLFAKGTAKGKELEITDIIKPSGKKGPRYLIEGYGDKQFIKMNANSYLGMSMHPQIIKAEETAAHKYGVGPGAVRFISGTHTPHIELEEKLAKFHGREAAMIFS